MRARRSAAAVGAAALALLSLLPSEAEGQLSEQHRRLQTLVGEWGVEVDGVDAGTATGRLLLQGQFVEVHVIAEAGPVRNAIYTFGWDDRHGRYIVSAMDETGTYWVNGQGNELGGRIPMYGTDDDPTMSAMGLSKEFVIELTITSPMAARIETRLIDTRTEARTELPFFGFTLVR